MVNWEDLNVDGVCLLDMLNVDVYVYSVVRRKVNLNNIRVLVGLGYNYLILTLADRRFKILLLVAHAHP